MALIKSTSSQRLLKDAIVLDIGDLNREAERILVAARAEADQVMAAACAEAARLTEGAEANGHARGHEEGFAVGRALGMEQGRAEALTEWSERLAQLTESWIAALEQWRSDRSAMHHAAQEEVIVFALALGERIARRTIAQHPESVRDQLAAALSIVERASDLTIAVHPEDRPTMEAVVPQLTASIVSGAAMELVDDPTLMRGGCVVRTRGGSVDASIDTQLNRIVEALLPGHGERSQNSGQLPVSPNSGQLPVSAPTTAIDSSQPPSNESAQDSSS